MRRPCQWEAKRCRPLEDKSLPNCPFSSAKPNLMTSVSASRSHTLQLRMPITGSSRSLIRCSTILFRIGFMRKSVDGTGQRFSLLHGQAVPTPQASVGSKASVHSERDESHEFVDRLQVLPRWGLRLRPIQRKGPKHLRPTRANRSGPSRTQAVPFR